MPNNHGFAADSSIELGALDPPSPSLCLITPYPWDLTLPKRFPMVADGQWSQ